MARTRATSIPARPWLVTYIQHTMTMRKHTNNAKCGGKDHIKIVIGKGAEWSHTAWLLRRNYSACTSCICDVKWRRAIQVTAASKLFALALIAEWTTTILPVVAVDFVLS